MYSQTPEELRKQADLLFDQGKFVEATPLYSKILAQQPRDYEVNFRYGTCLLYNSHNKEEAIRYLSYAVKGADIDKRAFYYLGRAYHLNYQFNEAIIQYEKFKSVANPAQIKTLEVDQQILACKNGKKLLSNVTDMIVIQKTEIRAEDFYEIYKLNNIGGTILVTDEFQSKMDKQNGHRAIIHFPANSPAIYYSSYGEDGSTGLDIYVKRKLPDGKYSQAQKVQGGVNTTFDENYAYMHPDGKYLYFCSKGHNSMGGYDVSGAHTMKAPIRLVLLKTWILPSAHPTMIFSLWSTALTAAPILHRPVKARTEKYLCMKCVLTAYRSRLR